MTAKKPLTISPAQHRLLVDARELRRERESGRVDRLYRMAASFDDTKQEILSGSPMVDAGLVEANGSITDFGLAMLASSSTPRSAA